MNIHRIILHIATPANAGSWMPGTPLDWYAFGVNLVWEAG